MIAKLKHNTPQEDEIKHKIVAYFILRKLSRLLPLGVAKRLAYLLMASKELLDMAGLGRPEKRDIKANNKGIEEASNDIINKKPYRYKLSTKKLVKDLLVYLRLKH